MAAIVEPTSSQLADDTAWIEELRATLNSALRGKEQVIEFVMAGLLARGHLLIEDVPGLGKTTLAKALAGAIGGKLARVQCTPDLLPGDVTGFNLFNQQTHAMEFMRGPVFADVLLVDEINRATPRTQSALLEVMAEQQVTVDNHTYPLSDRFFVIATQNPIELEGTFPLPEAQLDRFAMRLTIGYPDKQHVVAMLGASIGQAINAAAAADPVVSHEQLLATQALVSRVAVSADLQHYVAELGEATRNHPRVRLGISPRGLLIWLRIAQAWAVLSGRDYVTPDDIQQVAEPVLSVRLIHDERDARHLVEELLSQVRVPAY